jgi:hypothetical protein
VTPDQPQARKPRSRKIYILWGVALTLLISTALFCWLVVVPVWQVNRVVEDCFFASLEAADNESPCRRGIETLGGEAAASRKLVTYLRAPEWLIPDNPEVSIHGKTSYLNLSGRQSYAVFMLSKCGPRGVDGLESLLEHHDLRIRRNAAEALERIKAAESTSSPR